MNVHCISFSIEIGLSGDECRRFDMRLCQDQHVRHIAYEVRKRCRQFQLDIDNKSIKIVHGVRHLLLQVSIRVAGIVEGCVLQAIIGEQWQVAMHNKNIEFFTCDCLEGPCFCIAPTFEFNTQLLERSALRIGGKTSLKKFFQECSDLDEHWNDKYNDGQMAEGTLQRLIRECSHEWVWCCMECRDLAFCMRKSCWPNTLTGWYERIDVHYGNVVYCGRCYRKTNRADNEICRWCNPTWLGWHCQWCGVRH
jgi:hypothetical protein